MPVNKTAAASPHGKKRQQKAQNADIAIVRLTLALVFFTGVLAIAAIVSDVIFWRQLNSMNGQLDEMKKASEQANRLIVANEKLSNATAEIVDLNKKAAEINERQLRAQISFPVAEIDNFDGSSLGPNVQISNTGAAAAKGRMWSDIKILPVAIANFPALDTRGNPTEITVPPNSEPFRPIRRRTISSAERNAVIAGTSGIFVYGEFRFTDETKISKKCVFGSSTTAMESSPKAVLHCMQQKPGTAPV